MSTKDVMNKIEDGWKSEKHSVEREWASHTPNGNPMSGRWVLRNKYGIMIDFDTYVNDLADRHGLDLYSTMSS